MADELNYLIVGGLSYIGLHIAEYLLNKYSNIKLTILDLSSNTTYTNEILKKFRSYPQQCFIIVGSGSNSELVKKILEERKVKSFYCSSSYYLHLSLSLTYIYKSNKRKVRFGLLHFNFLLSERSDNVIRIPYRT